jgi:hypothetical protein
MLEEGVRNMPLDYVSNTLKSKFGIDLDKFKGFPTAPWAPPEKTEAPCVTCGSNNIAMKRREWFLGLWDKTSALPLPVILET